MTTYHIYMCMQQWFTPIETEWFTPIETSPSICIGKPYCSNCYVGSLLALYIYRAASGYATTSYGLISGQFYFLLSVLARLLHKFKKLNIRPWLVIYLFPVPWFAINPCGRADIFYYRINNIIILLLLAGIQFSNFEHDLACKNMTTPPNPPWIKGCGRWNFQ